MKEGERREKLRAWIDQRVEDSEDRCTLQNAAAWGNLELLRFLFELGADIHVTDKLSSNVMHSAAENDCP